MYSKYTVETIFAKNVSMVSRVFLMNAAFSVLNNPKNTANDPILSTNAQFQQWTPNRIMVRYHGQYPFTAFAKRVPTNRKFGLIKEKRIFICCAGPGETAPSLRGYQCPGLLPGIP